MNIIQRWLRILMVAIPLCMSVGAFAEDTNPELTCEDELSIVGPGNYCYQMNSLGQIRIRGNGGPQILLEAFSGLWFYGATIIGIVAVLMIVIAGSMYITGTESMIRRARRIFGLTILALILYFGFGALFQAVAPTWFGYRLANQGGENISDTVEGLYDQGKNTVKTTITNQLNSTMENVTNP